MKPKTIRFRTPMLSNKQSLHTWKILMNFVTEIHKDMATRQSMEKTIHSITEDSIVETEIAVT